MMQKTFLLAATLMSSLVACGDKDADDDTGAADCGEHGEWDEDHDHCHCDDGYQLTDDFMDCEPEDGDSSGSGDEFAPSEVSGTILPDEGPVWLLNAQDGSTWLSIENYAAYGGASGPETRSIDATEVDYATCGVCVRLQLGCEPHGDHAHCETTLMPAVGGAVTFDALGEGAGEAWTGSLSDIRFIEVEIDSSTYATTPVEDGATFTLDAWSFDVVLDEAR